MLPLTNLRSLGLRKDEGEAWDQELVYREERFTFGPGIELKAKRRASRGSECNPGVLYFPLRRMSSDLQS